MSEVRATLVYDGDCEICRYWVEYWKRQTGGRVVYRPYQEAASDFPTIKLEDFRRRHSTHRAGRAGVRGRGGDLPRIAPRRRAPGLVVDV